RRHSLNVLVKAELPVDVVPSTNQAVHRNVDRPADRVGRSRLDPPELLACPVRRLAHRHASLVHRVAKSPEVVLLGVLVLPNVASKPAPRTGHENLVGAL